MTQRVTWVLSNGLVGMDNQSVGLAEALGLTCVKKLIVPTFPWTKLPPNLWLSPLKFLDASSDPLLPPWPDVVIGTGRLSVAVAVAIKKASGGKTVNIRIQHPGMSMRQFDLVITPQHDHCRGENVIESLGAVNHVTQAKLDAAEKKFASQFGHLPRPLTAVLLGGTNKSYVIDTAFANSFADKLIAALKQSGGTLLITPSRRTDVAALQTLRERLAGHSAIIWDGLGENPYFGYLALADYIIVTADSVNLASEASFTGKPVFVVGLTGGRGKFEEFHRSLQARGCTRPFTGDLAHWQYTPLDETSRVATEIKQRLGW